MACCYTRISGQYLLIGSRVCACHVWELDQLLNLDGTLDFFLLRCRGRDQGEPRCEGDRVVGRVDRQGSADWHLKVVLSLSDFSCFMLSRIIKNMWLPAFDWSRRQLACCNLHWRVPRPIMATLGNIVASHVWGSPRLLQEGAT